jgi:hypothetical protein
MCGVMNSYSNGGICVMDVNRNVIKRINMKEDIDDGYVENDKAELLSVMWEITKDAWAFVRGQDAEQRLQRDVAVFIGRKS